ncbi:MAG: hypothetical protein ACOY31_06035 [Bacillota bacterium]
MQEINWKKLYSVIDELTPLKSDCGDLCGKKCCRGEAGQGVFLFPGEEKMFSGEGKWYNVVEYRGQEAHYTGRETFILNCLADCPRQERPLFCRLFPLAPYLDENGRLELILDEDALFICPLVRQGDIQALDPGFREGVGRVWEELLRNEVMQKNVREYSARMKSQMEEPWMKLLK